MQILRRWFINNQRDFPWRRDPHPYAVWVSEVMLQQTRASVVIPYFERWMELFPTIQVLSEAPLEAVIKAWEGLGYYSRARNLHEGARYVMEHFNGCLPSDARQLRKIKGLGPYTIGAIQAFAFGQKAAAVDGNVLRVMARYHNIHDDIAKSATIEHVRQLTQDFLPEESPGEVMEALIELGATLCGKQPLCARCPLNESCSGFALGTAAGLPIKKKGPKTELLQRAVALIFHEEQILVRRCSKGEIMSDLHEFPYTDDGSITEVLNRLKHLFGPIKLMRTLPQVQHSFTRYKATLTPYCLASDTKSVVPGYFWQPRSQLDALAFSSGHRRIAQLLKES